MTVVVRFFWLFVLIMLPLSFFLLYSAADGSVSPWVLLQQPWQLLLFLLVVVFTATGLYDLFFADSNLRKNYPVFANIRFMLEAIRPEIRQYFIADNLEEAPFNRETRDLIYRRGKQLDDTIPFGTERDILAEGYLCIFHSINARHIDPERARVVIGGPACRQPYNSALLNISGMSFGALSNNAISALNKGARLGGFSHNTGEGGISPYHLQHGGDLVWQIGTGYFGCRQADGLFSDDAFRAAAANDVVKMIEIKLSQGAKPSHGGVLPGAKVSAEIAAIRLVEIGVTVYSPASHPEFDTPRGLLEFVQRLRDLSEGKPIGFKLCIGKKSEFMAIVKAMVETGILPDFITIDGAEGGTGAAPVEFSNRLGMPVLEAIYFVEQVLKGAGLRQDIKLIAAGKNASGFDMLAKIALGADVINSARAMMLALGCIQSKSCNTNKCPTGVATQDASRAKAVNVELRAVRVRNYQAGTVSAFLELCGALGYEYPGQLKPSDLHQRTDRGLRHFDQIYTPLSHEQLIVGRVPEAYEEDWHKARADRF
ncbi:glutamate synthase [Pseudohongiella acticola]|jgi:glutamate synthase domain-containing protein 2|uniref:Glutamate synthase n=1 Tax=Pseudohongiella acticola TaxID=1524254 RepID=A0A1E8CI73_9GAMM|nr:FMN-binding glutamate synthase family protein [Pseudohongiella acticola]OFE12098.1 glutamate synthase [Pseudohongiella acticola]